MFCFIYLSLNLSLSFLITNGDYSKKQDLILLSLSYLFVKCGGLNFYIT